MNHLQQALCYHSIKRILYLYGTAFTMLFVQLLCRAMVNNKRTPDRDLLQTGCSCHSWHMSWGRVGDSLVLPLPHRAAIRKVSHFLLLFSQSFFIDFFFFSDITSISIECKFEYIEVSSFDFDHIAKKCLIWIVCLWNARLF